MLHRVINAVNNYTSQCFTFADDIDGLAGSEHELSELIRKLNDSCVSYGMEISAEKTKIMTNTHANGLQNEISINGSVLQCVDQFVYLGAIVSDSGSRTEILSRMEKPKVHYQNSKLFGMIN